MPARSQRIKFHTGECGCVGDHEFFTHKLDSTLRELLSTRTALLTPFVLTSTA